MKKRIRASVVCVMDDQSPLKTHYVFRWNAQVYDCETCWFRGTVAAAPTAAVTDAEYLLQVRWIPLNRIGEMFSYHPAILDAINRLVSG